MSCLVITSVNPYGDINNQLNCFKKWKSVGYNIFSYNCSDEVSLLLESGFNADDLVEISDKYTAISLFNKKIPRIKPILEKALSEEYTSFILVNSDIYPSHRKPVDTFLVNLNDAIALTRNECVFIPNYKYSDSTPYRGGLDMFYFSRAGLENILGILHKSIVSERMTFGIPGWDYYLGHTILAADGLIMDSEISLHQSHKTSYGKIDEFNYYAEEMLKSGVYKQSEINAIANEFSGRIHAECEKNSDKSRLIKRMFYAKPTLSDAALNVEHVSTIIQHFSELAKSFNVEIKINKALKGFVLSQFSGVSWAAAESYRKNEMNGVPIIQSSFILLTIQLLIKRYCNSLNPTCNYPEGNMHGVALNQILTNTVGAERMHYLIGLFASELAEHNVFNKQLYTYFVLAANTQRTLSTCALISTVCRKK